MYGCKTHCIPPLFSLMIHIKTIRQLFDEPVVCYLPLFTKVYNLSNIDTALKNFVMKCVMTSQLFFKNWEAIMRSRQL
jgi:hypothetical protein